MQYDEASQYDVPLLLIHHQITVNSILNQVVHLLILLLVHSHLSDSQLINYLASYIRVASLLVNRYADYFIHYLFLNLNIFNSKCVQYCWKANWWSWLIMLSANFVHQHLTLVYLYLQQDVHRLTFNYHLINLVVHFVMI